MANSVKYNTSAESLALNTGYFWIGTGDVAKGPTSTTGFWSAINPSNIDNDFADGYTIYQNKASQGPSIRVASSDAELITITNQIIGSVFTTVEDCLDAWVKDTDGFVLNSYINPIITDGLVLALDAGLVPSYPRSGTDWYDLSSESNNGTLENGPTFNSNGYLEFDGDDDYVPVNGAGISDYSSPFSMGIWFRVDSTATWDNGYRSNIYSIAGSYAGQYGLFKYDSDVFGVQLRDSNSTIYATVSGNSKGIWYNLVSTWDGSILKLYRDGELVSTQTAGGITGAPDSTNLYIAGGRAFGGAQGNVFEGDIASCNYYNKELSTIEILQNYYQAPIVTDGLVYAIDPGNLVSYENGSTTAYSLTGSLSGALTNGVAYNGSTGGTWDFDGVDDYIEIPYDSYWDTNVFGEAENFTIMCWTKCNNFYNWSSMIEKDNGGYYSESEGASLWANVSGFQAVFGNGVPGNPSGWGFNIQYSTSNTTDWFHVAFTGDGTTGRFYVNGDEVSNRLLSVRSATVVTTTNPPKIGVRGSTSNYEGQISTTLLYDRGLTAEEVAQNYEAGKGRFSNVSIAP